MVVCAACLAESTEGARFCSSCGHALTAGATAAPARLEERKVVSVLFCDLVGFTAMSETADPEDLGRMLDAYAALARSAIRAHGGVVEKFIGDAVVGVFGVPATHEDDALRAVRAGLAICAAADGIRATGETTLRLRVGINTGEALVRLDIAPDAGERFMTGDPVNTAARIQSVAPEQGVAVGEATWQLTRNTVAYAELPAATLKGKADPVRVFHATGLRDDSGADLASSHVRRYVGRAAELARLRAVFDRAASDARSEFVLVVGEPGIGKSRFVAELRRHAEAASAVLTWRQGRCLPYGDGITFWALGEVVKAHAAILDGDGPDVAIAKLDAVLPSGDERDWLRARLQPLIGIEGTTTPTREEAFAAWRRFLSSLAQAGPAVVVLEDLHWADEALLAFVAHLADQREQVPLVVIGTTRPELLARDRTLLAVGDDARIDLGPLTDDETGAFVADVLGSVLPAAIREVILERAEGNPLFAEEYVRLLDERGLLADAGDASEPPSMTVVPVPDSLGSLLAARLDTLPRARKAILSDASVVGQVFWAGTVASMGERDRDTVLDELAQLTRLEFVRPIEPSSMSGEDESAFWHALGRDVAYAQLPRSARAARHVAVATWLEAKAGDRAGDIADVLAHHLTTALELAEATGDEPLATAVRPQAARLLRLAGDRALGLDTAAALVAYERALALMADDDPDRATATFQVATARFHAGQYEDAVAAYEDALDRNVDAGDQHAAALVKLDLARALQWVGRVNWELQVEAVATLEAEGPSADLLRGLGMLTFVHLVRDRPAEAMATADRAIELAAMLGLPPPAGAYAWRGSTRCLTGDPGGLDDGRMAIALATAAGAARDAAIYRHEYAANVSWFVSARAAEVATMDLVEFAASRGLRGLERLGRAGVAFTLWDQGLLVEAEAAVHSSIEAFEAAGDLSGIPSLRVALLQFATLRGDVAEASGLAAALETDPHLEDSSDSPGFLAAIARAYAEAGELDGARRVLARMATQEIGAAYRGAEVRDAVIAALAIGDRDLIASLVDASDDPRPYSGGIRRQARALVAEVDGDLELAATEFGAAATILDAFSTPQHTHCLLGLGRCLVALGRDEAAVAPLTEARDLAVRMGARPWITEATALLARIRGIETPAGGTPAGA